MLFITILTILTVFYSVTLQQWRYTYRHNVVLTYIVKSVLSVINENKLNVKMYADLKGHNINGGTIPPAIVHIAEEPDMNLIFSQEKTLFYSN